MKCSFCNDECDPEEFYDGGEMWACNKHPYKVMEYISHTYHIKGACTGNGCCPQKHHSNTVIICYPYKVKFYRHPAKWFSIFKYQSMVFKLHFHPTINPENVKEKLKMWLPFS